MNCISILGPCETQGSAIVENGELNSDVFVGRC